MTNSLSFFFRRTSRALIVTLSACGFAAGLTGVTTFAGQAAPQEAYPGSKMTQQQILDKLTSDAPGTKVSVARGKEVYEEVCAVCHIFEDLGTPVGPDLTTLSSRFGKRDILESILWPSRTISDQYALTVFELADGSFASGVIVRESAQAVFIKNNEYLDRPLPIATASIVNRTESTVSLMPEGLVAPYTLDDIDSLVSFLRGGR